MRRRVGFECWRQKFEGDEHCGNEINERAEDPHESAGESLIRQRRPAKDCRGLLVRRIENTVAEHEKGTERSAGKHANKKINRNRPAMPANGTGKRLDHRPPKQDGSGEEAEMFDIVPKNGAQREFECRGNMPGNQRDCGGNPAERRVGDEFSEAVQRRPSKSRTNEEAHEELRQAVEKRNGGRAEEHEGRNDEHEENVLNHVDGEGGFIKCGKRRADGKPQEEHGGEKCGESPNGKDGRGSAAKGEPSTKIDCGREQERKIEWEWRRPLVEQRLRGGRHDQYGWPPAGGACSEMAFSAATRAGTCAAGCRVLRNATNAVTSGGLRALP